MTLRSADIRENVRGEWQRQTDRETERQRDRETETEREREYCSKN